MLIFSLSIAYIAALTCLVLAMRTVHNAPRKYFYTMPNALPVLHMQPMQPVPPLPLRKACLALGHACLAVKHSKAKTPKSKPLSIALAERTQARHDLIMAQLYAKGYYN